MVLPAGGVALCWMLATTLLMAPLDYARSHRSLVERIAAHVPRDACITAEGLPLSLLAALEYAGPYRVEAAAAAPSGSCEFLLRVEGHKSPTMTTSELWHFIAQVQRPADKTELIGIYQRKP